MGAPRKSNGHGGARKGAGRKPKVDAAAQGQVSMSARLWPHQMRLVEVVAARARVSRAEALRIILDDAVKPHAQPETLLFGESCRSSTSQT